MLAISQGDGIEWGARWLGAFRIRWNGETLPAGSFPTTSSLRILGRWDRFAGGRPGLALATGAVCCASRK